MSSGTLVLANRVDTSAKTSRAVTYCKVMQEELEVLCPHARKGKPTAPPCFACRKAAATGWTPGHTVVDARARLCSATAPSFGEAVSAVTRLVARNLQQRHPSPAL